MTFPRKVNLYEVGPRDGLQNEKEIIPTDVKVNFINKLMDNPREINCKEIFRKAYENRYTWKNEFNGYKGSCILYVNENIHEGNYLCIH